MSRTLPAVCLLASGLACSGGGRSGSALSSRSWPPARPGYVNPIPAENALAGEDWNAQGTPNLSCGQTHTSSPPAGMPSCEVELYVDRTSARAGETVQVMVSVGEPSGSGSPHPVSWALFRLGWYGGAGSRKIAQGSVPSVSRQPPCPIDPATALLRCAWTPTFALALPESAVSGIYAVRVLRDDGFRALTPLVVVDDRPSDLIMQANVTTWQAYNAWGGESLYGDSLGLTKPLGTNKAVQVSFDRPYALAGGLSDLVHLEAPFARFLERNGYDVSYTTNLEVARGGKDYLLKRGAYISVGHDEYWPGAERDAAQQARDAGVPLLFFGGNDAYWKVRLEAESVPGNARVVTCYKDIPGKDPAGLGATGRYQDAPIDEPESELLGNMYGGFQTALFPWVVADASSWLFAGTGLKNGDSFPLIVGNEFEHTPADGARMPAGVQVLGRSPAIDALGRASYAETVAFRAQSGALVFSAGAIYWPHGLARRLAREAATTYGYDPRMERMAANVLNEALGLAVPDGVDEGDAHPAPVRNGAYANSVGTLVAGLRRPAVVAVRPNGNVIVAEHPPNPEVNGVGWYDPSRILEVTPQGQVTVLAGPENGFSRIQVGVAREQFTFPTGLAIVNDAVLGGSSASESVLVTDSFDASIRRIDSAGNDSVVVSGLANPMGLAVDPAAKVAYVALAQDYDPQGNSILAVDLSGVALGKPAALKGAGAVNFPSALALASDGRLFVSNVQAGTPGLVVRERSGAIVPLVSNDSSQSYLDGPGTLASFGAQLGAVWWNGRLLLSDPGNGVVRAVVPGTDAASTTVFTFAGSGAFGSADGPAASASFGLPLGLALGPDGKIYVADAGAGAIRVIEP